MSGEDPWAKICVQFGSPAELLQVSALTGFKAEMLPSFCKR